METISILLGLFAGLMWAFAQLSGKISLRTSNAYAMNFIRFSVMLPVMTALLSFGTFNIISNTSTESPVPTLNISPSTLNIFNIKFQILNWCYILLAMCDGVLGWGINSTIYFFILKKEPFHRIVPIANAFPVWVAFLSVFFFNEKITFTLISAIVLMLMGVRLLIPEEKEKTSGRKWKWGMPLAVMVSVLWAVAVILSKYLLKYMQPELLLFFRILAVFLFFLFILPIVMHFKSYNNKKAKMQVIKVQTPMQKLTTMHTQTSIPTQTLMHTHTHTHTHTRAHTQPLLIRLGKILGLNKNSILFSAISGITLIIGEFSYLFVLKKGLASHTTIVCNTVIPFGFLLSVIFLKEKPSFKRYTGMFLVFGAVILISIFS